MKYLSIVFIILFSLSSFAGRWNVGSYQDEFYIMGPKGKTFSILSVGGKPKFLYEKDFKEKYLLLVYQAGTAGTSQPIVVQRALIIKKGSYKFVGDAPFAYSPSAGTTYNPTQPVWKTDKANVLEVVDSEAGESVRIELD